MNQKEQLLKYFQEEDFSITSLECMQKLMILDLQGIKIESIWISKKNMYGDIKKFKRYYLIKDDIDFVQFDRERAVLNNIVIQSGFQ